MKIRAWIKEGRHPVARLLRTVSRTGMPCVPVIHKPLYKLHVTLCGLFSNFWRIVYFTPLFRARLCTPSCKGLYLYSGLPYVSGPLSIRCGDNCRISGKTTLSGRTTSNTPVLLIGNNCDIGWMTTIAVGGRVCLGNNVRLAGRNFLAGYPGHPTEAKARARGLPDTPDQVGDIILEDDVWLATGASIMAGVRIGHGSIIAAGSVVTKDIPAGVLAGGIPAKVIRKLEQENG